MPSHFFADLVRETSNATGTGVFALSGAVPGHRRFVDTVPPGASFFYSIASVTTPDQWEAGQGTLNSAGALQRDVIAASSNGGAPTEFSGGLKTVALTVGATWFAGQEGAQDAVDAALATLQPISTGHGAASSAMTTDTVTLRRAAGWLNLPMSAIVHRSAAGRFVANAPVDFTAGSAAAVGVTFGGDAGSGLFSPAANSIAVAAGGSERVRFTADGRIGVGVAAPTSAIHVEQATNGVGLTIGAVTQTSSQITLGVGTVTAGFPFIGTNVSSNALQIGTRASADVLFLANSAERMRVTTAGHWLPGSDNAQNVGSGALRMATIFAGTGTINTSDAREKSWRGALTEPEMRAAGRIARAIGVYQWNDAVEAKGPDKARLHIGVRAQAVWAIMADEGLVDPIGKNGKPGATPYAFLCWDNWDGEEAATTGDRFGVRVDQLALFIAAAQEMRLAGLEKMA